MHGLLPQRNQNDVHRHPSNNKHLTIQNFIQFYHHTAWSIVVLRWLSSGCGFDSRPSHFM